jgi:hypothetical protein
MNNEHLQSLVTPKMEYNEYNAAILRAGDLTMIINNRKCEGWFQLSHGTLAPLLSSHNQLLHAIRRTSHLPKSVQATMQGDLQQLNRHVTISVSHAKAKWCAKICSNINNMRFNPRAAWEHNRLLAKGKTTHHKNCKHGYETPGWYKSDHSF